MSNPNKTRGDTWERAVRDYLHTNGFPWTERTRAGYARDHGDLHLVPGPVVICQAKNTPNRDRWPEWLAELAEQITESGAEHGFLAAKRKGVADPGEALAVMPLRQLALLLRAAGYGDPPEATP